MATATITTAMQSVASQTFTVKEIKKGKVSKRVSEPSDEVLALVKRAVELDKREKAVKAEKDQIKDQIKDLMRDQGIDQFVHAGVVRASYSESFPALVDNEALDEANPGLRDAYRVPATEPKRVVTLK